MKTSTLIYIAVATLFTSRSTANLLDLSDYGLCEVPGDVSDCAFACHEMVKGEGNCVFNKCYCTDKPEAGKCEDDDHETCDAFCQELSGDYDGFCMDNQCSCLL